MFKQIPSIPLAQELIDKAFRRAARARKGKISTSISDAERASVLTAGNILADNLSLVVRKFPSLDKLPDFYRELADILVGVDKLKKSLCNVNWASKKIKELSRKYIGLIKESEDASKLRRQAFGRMASVISDIKAELEFLSEAREKLRRIPTISDEPTIVVAGYANVGKSSFVARVSSAKPLIAEYPFTTKGIMVGHFHIGKKRYQVIDTPGLLDRPLSQRNQIERQAIAAIRHVGDVILFIIDPTETCGYTLEAQLNLLTELKELITVPVLVVANKADLLQKTPSIAELKMSSLTGEGIEEVKSRLAALINQKQERANQI
ncbi:MAG: NOG1 family protein [Methanocellales archaeon]